MPQFMGVSVSVREATILDLGLRMPDAVRGEAADDLRRRAKLLLNDVYRVADWKARNGC